MTCRGVILPEKLPPTERAAHFHGLRAHYQIMDWSLLDKDLETNPQHWGWAEKDGSLIPIATDLGIAPPSLNKVIRCNCKKSSKNLCSTMICTCKKFGLPCFPYCTGCRGEECDNCVVSSKNIFSINVCLNYKTLFFSLQVDSNLDCHDDIFQNEDELVSKESE